MFKPVSAKLNPTVMEEGILRFWKANDIFKKSSDERKDRRPFVIYEGRLRPTASQAFTTYWHAPLRICSHATKR